ncbi:hypothetical protein PC9H_008588 [Pleurotus ostreatus]|uniref:Carbohydrate-binding module family 13 protein n=2 Tax=Pleurotus ostreatus TaxID=5322 RepID=A0A067NYA5_PLEO1|nr:uncharacterized protein PC9H_008588 [Pleurotus ostreatus]KAF7426221.1 hypothetical protein PC9H_008588 [Pleurotus ostreatus]KDQ31960.1 carbohydrate-binding module family 13 protein [Pleurotus ostreatus PC15]
MVNLQPGAKYKFVNAKANNVADLSGGDNKSIIGYSDHNGANQTWEALPGGNGWIFKNVATGQYLGINGLARDGTPVEGIHPPFEWHVKNDEGHPDTVRLFVPNTLFNMDLSDNGNATAGTKIQVWNKWTPGVNQCWRLVQGTWALAFCV